MDTAANRKNALRFFAVAGIVGLVSLAGCLDGLQESDEVDAVLDVSEERAWNGEDIVFDGQASEAEDEIRRWEFDFGDGTTAEVSNEEAARMRHAYEKGGVYQANLTVTAGEGEDTVNDTTSQMIVIDERNDVAGAAVADAPLGAENGTFAQDYEASEGVHETLLNLTIDNTLVLGSSEVVVRYLDPEGEALFEETYTIGGDAVEVEETLMTDELGTYGLEVEVLSGAVAINGTVEILYEDPADLE